MDLSITSANDLSEDSIENREIDSEGDLESQDCESDKMEFDETINTNDLYEEDESSMATTSYQRNDEQTESDSLLSEENDTAMRNKKSYTIEYEWEVQNSKSNSNDIGTKNIQNLEKSEDQAVKNQNQDKSSERRRRKRERKDVTRTPNYNEWLQTRNTAESTNKYESHALSDIETGSIAQYRKNNMTVEQSTNETKNDAETANKSKSDAQPEKKKRKPRTRRIYSCDLCSKIFKKSSHLIRHVRTHTGEKPFSCGVCGDSFSLNSILKSHMLIHTHEKPFSCDLCELKFSRSGDLKSHRRVHTGEKPYQCLFCGRFFRQSGVLKKHERIHTGEKPYTCTICGRSFRQNGDAQKHIRTHTGEKPFECHICGKEFARNNDMQTHVRRHTGEKPYSCGVCSKSFVDNCGLRRHMKIHTRELKIPRIPELKTKKTKKQKTEILVSSAPELMLGLKPELLSRLRPDLFLKPNTSDTSESVPEQVTKLMQDISEKRGKVSVKEMSEQSKVNTQHEQLTKLLFNMSEVSVPQQFEETTKEDTGIKMLLPDLSSELQTNHIALTFPSGWQGLRQRPNQAILPEAFPVQTSENNLELSQKTELQQKHYSSSNPISERPIDYTVQQLTEPISNLSTDSRPLTQFSEEYHVENVTHEFLKSTTELYADSAIPTNSSQEPASNFLTDSRQSKQFPEKKHDENIGEQFLVSTTDLYANVIPHGFPNHLPGFDLKQKLMVNKLLDARFQQASATMSKFAVDSRPDQYKVTNYDQTGTELFDRPTQEQYAGITRFYPKPKPTVFPDHYRGLNFGSGE